MTQAPPAGRGGEWWIRCLVRLYPAAFREEFGGEMRAVFLDEASARSKTGAGAAWFWARTTVVTAWCALAEHAATTRDRLGHASRAERTAARRRRFEAVRRQLVSDVRAALAGVERRPWQSAALTALAAAIAAFVVAASGVARAGLWRPAYPAPHRLVRIETAFLDMDYESFPVSPFEFVNLEARVQAYEAIGAWAVRMRSVSIDGHPTRERLVWATPGMFEALGLDPPERPGESGPRPVYATTPFWRSRFSADPHAVGRIFEIDGAAVRLAGILPEDFHFWIGGVSLWVPFVFPPVPDGEANHILGVVARLRHGQTLDDARREMRAISGAWSATHPGHHGPDRLHPFRVRPLEESLIGAKGPPFHLLWLCAGGLLLLALLHLADVRSGGGSGAMPSEAIRRALLAVAGSTVGTSMAVVGLLAWSTAPLGPFARGGVPGAAESAVFIALILASAAAATVGALRLSRGPRLGGILVALDVAASIGLLFGAGMLARSLSNLRERDLGFQPSGLIAFDAALPAPFADSTIAEAMADRIAGIAASFPSVIGVALTSSVPVSPEVLPSDVVARQAGDPSEAQPRRDRAYLHYVSPGYTALMGMSFVEGRPIRGGAEAVVSATLARRLWPEGRAVGSAILPFEMASAPYATVVGVVADVAQTAPVDGAAAQLYLAREAVPQSARRYIRAFTLVLRSTNPTRTMTSIPPGLTLDGYTIPVSQPARLGARVEAAARELTLLLWLLGAGAVLCLALGLATAAIVLDPPGRVLPSVARIGAGLAGGLIVAVGVRSALDPVLLDTGLGDVRVVIAVVVGLSGWAALALRLGRGQGRSRRRIA